VGPCSELGHSISNHSYLLKKSEFGTSRQELSAWRKKSMAKAEKVTASEQATRKRTQAVE
jgi:hypothetical protein